MNDRKLRIRYVANIRLPTEKAHGIQIMKTCEALAALGHDIELIVPDRKTDIPDDPFSYYGLTTRFPVTRLPVWDTVRYGRLGFLLESFLFAQSARRHLVAASFDVVYGRDELVLARLPGPYVWESHTGAWNAAARAVARDAKRIIVISEGLKAYYAGKGVPAHKIAVAHDGVDLDAFARPESRHAARARLGLPQDAAVAMYVGRLDGWKGTDTLLAASARMQGVTVAMIGGEPAQTEALARQHPDVRFLGARPYTELAGNMAAADVLVLPNTGKDEISARFTSPLKLFAYMTSGVPIVASDLPSLREVVDEDAAYLVPADDAEALAKAVGEALTGGGARAAEARRRVEAYSWRRRAERIAAAL